MKRRAALRHRLRTAVRGTHHDDAYPRTPDARMTPEITRLARSVAGLPRFAARGRRGVPRGAGPVMVIPGYMTSDRSTLVVRRFLAAQGFEVRGWGLGLNRGNVERVIPPLIEKVIAHAAGRPIQLVGWSQGGIIAREMTREAHGEGRLRVEHIVTMGTPVIGGPKYTATAERYAQAGYDLDAIEQLIASRNAEPLGVPVTAIYTRSDQIVHWRACLDPNPDNEVEYVEVGTGHFGLGFDAETLAIVADRLARRG